MQEELQSIRKCDYAAIRREIIETCKVSKASWANWVAGRRRPSPDNVQTIISVLQRYGYK